MIYEQIGAFLLNVAEIFSTYKGLIFFEWLYILFRLRSVQFWLLSGTFSIND